MLPSKATRLVPVLLAGLILAACSGQGPQQASNVNVQGPATGQSDYYLQQVQQSSDDSKTDWQILAIRVLLKEGKYPQAQDHISQLPQQLSEVQQQELLLLRAQLQIGQQDFDGAQQSLDKVKIDGLSEDQKVRYYGLQISAAHKRPSLTLLRAYIAQETLLKSTERQSNIDATWQALTQMTQDQLNNLVINADENTLQGWLDLLNTWHINSQDPQMLKAAIKDWQTRYPQNPGAKLLPTQLSQVQNFSNASTHTIALLLPLQGQAQIFANAIQKGFNDAKNGVLNAVPLTASTTNAPTTTTANAQQPTETSAADNPVVSPAAATTPPQTTQPQSTAQSTPATAQPDNSTQVKVYDTSNQPIAQVMQQAQQDGATIVVGPLLKNNVEQVVNSQTPLNMLALNEPEQIQNHPNICYFALSPEDEARDAAHHIYGQGKHQPLLLVTRDNYGDRVSKAFAQEWQMLSGATVLQRRFGGVSELKQAINSGAGITLSGIPVTVEQPQSSGFDIAGVTIPAPQTSTPAPATDASSGNIDAVYIVASQDELQRIKPMIAMRISSRSNVSLYTSSRSAQAGAGPDFRLEMEGLQFSDIPLLSGSNPDLMHQAVKAFNNNYSLVRLYAMGIDAWTLANHFNQMRQVPGFAIEGNTGKLSANANCVINRKLAWNQYRQGQIVPVQ